MIDELRDFQSLRIVFMGTPEFAVASLEALVNAGCNIVAVITSPDKPAGRGMLVQQSSVKKYASEKGFKILQPEKLKNPAFIEELRSLDADMNVVVAFRMLPDVVWNMPPMGTINVHASLLPQYRGAAPINWVIINGEKETGITTFKLQHEIDTGNILLQEKTNIGDDETAGELHDRLKVIGADLLTETVKGLAQGIIKEIDQSQIQDHSYSIIHHAPKIFTETCKIDWNKTADEIHNLIRGLSPHPGAFTFLNNKMLKIFGSKKEVSSHSAEPGSMETDNKTFLKFACRDGFVYVRDVQLEGKKRISIEEFLRGYRPS
jgi:methionyl-tRNA formyltransferase